MRAGDQLIANNVYTERKQPTIVNRGGDDAAARNKSWGVTIPAPQITTRSKRVGSGEAHWRTVQLYTLQLHTVLLDTLSCAPFDWTQFFCAMFDWKLFLCAQFDWTQLLLDTIHTHAFIQEKNLKFLEIYY